MPPPPPLPDLGNDPISEILLRLPPDEPKWLFRAALVCKPWLRTLSDTAFLHRYRAFHGAPPLLGLVEGEESIEAVHADQPRHFVPTTAVPASLVQEFDANPWRLDCRHGRVVLFSTLEDESTYYLVYDPVTGDRHGVPYPEIGIHLGKSRSSISVFCAIAGCDHLDCHGGPFFLLLVFTNSKHSPNTMSAAMYSSEIGAWRAPVTLEDTAVMPNSRGGPLIGDTIYFAVPDNFRIFKYDMTDNSLTEVEARPPYDVDDGFVLMVMEDRSLGLAGIKDFKLHIWSRIVSLEGIAEWVQCRVIDLEKKMPMVNPSHYHYGKTGVGLFIYASVVGFAEGVRIVFIKTGAGLFMMELKSGRVRKVDKPCDSWNVLPYMSFYTPDRLLGRPADM